MAKRDPGPAPAAIGIRGIASLLMVEHETAKKWRQRFLKAIREGRPPGPGCLPPPDTWIDGKPGWYPETVIQWAKQTERMSPEGVPQRPSPPGRPPDAVRRLAA